MCGSAVLLSNCIALHLRVAFYSLQISQHDVDVYRCSPHSIWSTQTAHRGNRIVSTFQGASSGESRIPAEARLGSGWAWVVGTLQPAGQSCLRETGKLGCSTGKKIETSQQTLCDTGEWRCGSVSTQVGHAGQCIAVIYVQRGFGFFRMIFGPRTQVLADFAFLDSTSVIFDALPTFSDVWKVRPFRPNNFSVALQGVWATLNGLKFKNRRFKASEIKNINIKRWC